MTDRERALKAAQSFDSSKAEFLEHEFETYDLLREHLPIAQVRAAPQHQRGDAQREDERPVAAFQSLVLHLAELAAVREHDAREPLLLHA